MEGHMIEYEQFKNKPLKRSWKQLCTHRESGQVRAGTNAGCLMGR